MKKALFLLILLMINLLSLSLIQMVKANPTYEDFTTYTEVDPNNKKRKRLITLT